MNKGNYYRTALNGVADHLANKLKIWPASFVQYRDRLPSQARFYQSTFDAGHRCFTWTLATDPQTAEKLLTMNLDGLNVAARLDEEFSVRVGRGRRGALVIEIPLPKRWWRNVTTGDLPRKPGLLTAVGLDTRRKPVFLNWQDPLMAHPLIAGTTGSGKTSVARLAIYDLAMTNGPGEVEFVLIDTRKKGKWWKDFEDIPHLGHPIVKDDEEALRVLLWACAEIDRRAESGRVQPGIFIYIDEAQVILDRGEFVKAIGDVAATGREFNIHLTLICQNPTAKQLGDTTIKRNMITRLVGRVDSPEAAHVATGQPKSGAEFLTGAGDLLFIRPGSVKRLTAGLLTDKDIAGLPRVDGNRRLDLGEYEDPDHVLAQADNGSKVRADDLDPAHVAVSLVAERGITWLCNRLSIGSAKARRVLEFADELRDELKAMGAYTTIPPYQQGAPGGRNGQDDDVSGMVVCQYKEVDGDR